MTSYIPYGRQHISEADLAAVADALQSPLITQGPLVERFERELAAKIGARYAVVFNSGTAALHAAYAAAGVGPGVSVLTSPITFVATANASLYLGGGAHFADVDPETALISPERVAEFADPTVRVLVPVHFGGQVADLERLSAVAQARGWVLIEDAAHALGARYRTAAGEHQIGACAHSAMCCFSFHPVKHITTGEGGAVSTNDQALYRRLLRFRTHGITRDPQEMGRNEGPWYYEQQELGFNYRLTDFQCALGSAQLARLDEFVRERREIAARYDEAFAGAAGVCPLRVPDGSLGSYHLYVVRVPASERRRVFEALRARDIGVNVHYIPVYQQPYYRRHGFAGLQLPGADAYYAEAISLPMYPGLTREQQQQQVVDALRKELAGAPSLATRRR